ncbi:gem-associated protein 6-like, partial [Pseudomyrmex gracilis]|uniref:gem-associated protein 6-like n=1 Tax=Pseudomyrmex gracilis TaxID=219809 RepID=UPI0009951E40
MQEKDTQEENTEFLHNVYKNDPILFVNYVGKEVKIITKDENIHSGIVYTIDPVSDSIVLLHTTKSTKYSLKIIFGHAVKNINVIAETTTIIPELFLQNLPCKELSQELIAKRKDIVVKVLSDSRFPVSEKNNTLLIEDIMVIEPPYYPENCKCNNSIVLSRIQNI